MKRLLWFGVYDLSFPRTRMLQAELRKRGIVVEECRVDPRKSKWKFSELWKQGRTFRGNTFDAVVVGYPGAHIVWLAKLLFRAPIVYDAGFSVYQAEVEDRRSCKPRSLRAARLYVMEWLAVRLADVIILDTRAHVEYFCQLFGTRSKKFFTLDVGADTDIFFAREDVSPAHDAFTAVFYGSFIPLHGVETILDAAALLRDRADIRFRLVGNGQTTPDMRRLADARALTNVLFTGRVPQTSVEGPSVLGEIRSADLLLGIFGSGRKAQMQVPLKVFEAMACAKPIVTADTPAVRELLVPDRDLVVVPSGDGAALAAAIVSLKNDPTRRAALAAHGHATFEKRFRPERLCDRFLSEMNRLLS